jgi:uncharacterized protein (DUF983 family)
MFIILCFRELGTLQAQDLSFPFSFVLIAGHLLVFIYIGVRELVQRNIFFKLLTFVKRKRILSIMG